MTLEKLAYTMKEAVAVSSIGRSSLYRAQQEGRIKFIKNGDSGRILASELKRFVESLPQAPVKGAK